MQKIAHFIKYNDNFSEKIIKQNWLNLIRVQFCYIMCWLSVLRKILKKKFYNQMWPDSFACNGNCLHFLKTNWKLLIFFFFRTNVDMDRQTITVLSPQPRPLPNNVLIFSEIQFMDSH